MRIKKHRWKVQNDDSDIDNSATIDKGDDSRDVLGGCGTYIPSTLTCESRTCE